MCVVNWNKENKEIIKSINLKYSQVILVLHLIYIVR